MERRRHLLLMLAALACTVVAVAVSWLLAPPMFGINDDAKIQLILSGGGWTTPSGHAVFINVVLGSIVAALFSLAPTVPWWFVWQVASVVVALYAWNLSILYAFNGSEGHLRPRRMVVTLAVCALSGVSVYMYALTLVSFTLTAGAMASCAVLLQCMRMAQPGLGARRRYGVLVALLVVLAYCTRSSSAIAALPFAALLFVPPLAGVLRHSYDRLGRARELGRVAFPLVVGIALAACCNVVNTAQYSSPEWREFLYTNNARHKYMDYPHDAYDENPSLYQSVGWSSQLERLVNDEWLFMDERVTPEAFLSLSKEGTQRDQLGLLHIYDSWRFGEGMFDSRTVTGILVLCVLCTVALLTLLRNTHARTQALTVLAAVALCALELYYLEMRGRLVTRVALVSLWPALAFFLGQTLTVGLEAARKLAADKPDPARSRHMVARGAGATILLLAAARFALAAVRTDAPWKLAYTLMLVLCAALVLLMGARTRTWMRYLVVGMLVPVLFVGCLLTKRDVRGTLVTIDDYQDVADAGISYVAEHPNLQFFCTVSLFSPFDPNDAHLPPNMLYVGGWEFYTPDYRERIATLRGDDTHNYDILLRDDVRVLCLTSEQADMLEACIEQVTGKSVEWEVAGHPGYGTLCQYRLA